MLQKCTLLHITGPPQPSCKVSILSFYCVLHGVLQSLPFFYLDLDPVVHFMEMATLYSAAFIVSYIWMDETASGFESCWLPNFCYQYPSKASKTVSQAAFLGIWMIIVCLFVFGCFVLTITIPSRETWRHKKHNSQASGKFK